MVEAVVKDCVIQETERSLWRSFVFWDGRVILPVGWLICRQVSGPDSGHVDFGKNTVSRERSHCTYGSVGFMHPTNSGGKVN